MSCDGQINRQTLGVYKLVARCKSSRCSQGMAAQLSIQGAIARTKLCCVPTGAGAHASWDMPVSVQPLSFWNSRINAFGVFNMKHLQNQRSNEGQAPCYSTCESGSLQKKGHWPCSQQAEGCKPYPTLVMKESPDNGLARWPSRLHGRAFMDEPVCKQ